MSVEIVSSKKLIEVAHPLDTINAAAVREKSIRHGHPSTLHLWWARCPLAAARAVLFAQLVYDPEDLWTSQNPGVGPNKQTRGHWTKARARLFKILEDLVLRVRERTKLPRTMSALATLAVPPQEAHLQEDQPELEQRLEAPEPALDESAQAQHLRRSQSHSTAQSKSRHPHRRCISYKWPKRSSNYLPATRTQHGRSRQKSTHSSQTELQIRLNALYPRMRQALGSSRRCGNK